MNLNTVINIGMAQVDYIHHSEIEGICMLAPRNIVSLSYANSYPFDLWTSVLLVLATLLTVLIWKVLAKSNLSTSFIIFNIFKCMIGRSVDEPHQITRKEKILIYSYILGSMILLSLYQSVIIAIMFTETKMTSIQSFKELNESKTKIYEYFADFESVPFKFRDEIVLSRIDPREQKFLLKVPDSFDSNLVYMVTCSYARAFVRSGRNFKGHRQLFDVIPENFAEYNPIYTVSTSFPLKKEFKRFVRALDESGIKNFWIAEMMSDKSNDLKQNLIESEDKILIDFNNMAVPFFVLFIGAAAGFIAFLYEKILSAIEHRRNLRIVRKFSF